MSTHPGDHSVESAWKPNNVYGSAIALLQANRVAAASPDDVHLDIGCGTGSIACAVSDLLRRHYVGLDKNRAAIDAVKAKGFEAHLCEFGDVAAISQRLREVIGTRRLVSVTLLDRLEYLSSPDHVLTAIAQVAAEHQAFVVVSAPNITYRDIGLKLAFGRWDYTQASLLDDTHVRYYTATRLEAELRGTGLHPIGAGDVCKTERLDANQPSHPALASGTSLSALLRAVQELTSPAASVTHFVRICVPGSRVAPAPTRDYDENTARPFLSVVVRTQGIRPHTLRELLVCLSGQSITDFEVLILGHHLTAKAHATVETVIRETPEWLRNQTRLIRVDEGNRTRPLNIGFNAAAGHYIAIVDDDDLVLGHWVETFKNLADRNWGKLLRATCVKQNVANVSVMGRKGTSFTAAPETLYPSAFDLFENLQSNQTPGLAMAFPRGAYHDLGIRFDESMTTTEDWDYILRTATLLGVASAPDVTCIYRWWEQAHSSRTEHAAAEWDRNYRRIQDKLDSQFIILPPGSASRLRGLLDRGNLAIHATAPMQPALERKSGWVRRAANSTGNTRHLKRKVADVLTTLRPGGSQKREEELSRKKTLLLTSRLFDSEWYREQYPDVHASGIDPVIHYLKRGWLERRNPSPLFDSNWYLREYPDVERAGMNPLFHYIQFGRKEGRRIKPL